MGGTVRESTTVVVVGAGAAGMTAAVLLRRCGIDCVVLEWQTREYVEQRQRAGIVEYRAARMFHDWGLGGLLGDFPSDTTLEIRVDGRPYLLGRDELSRRCPARLTPQQVLVRNLVSTFVDGGGDLRFQAAEVTLAGLEGGQPTVSYRDPADTWHEITCSFVAGCDGDHGTCRDQVPADALTAHSMEFGISWLTILAAAPPPPHPLMAASGAGFAAHFARGPAASRFYLQCLPNEQVSDWPDERIWAQLRARLCHSDLPIGVITDRELFPLRGVICEPMSYGRLYLLGDAAHIVPPTGGKGMNLALHDAEVFARGIRGYVQHGDEAGLRSYSDVCLRRAWTYQEYARWLTELVHDLADEDRRFAAKLAAARLGRVLSSEAAIRDLAELMAGLA
jgi:p-hydroxybenzoate 3-monooxygenase